MYRQEGRQSIKIFVKKIHEQQKMSTAEDTFHNQMDINDSAG